MAVILAGEAKFRFGFFFLFFSIFFLSFFFQFRFDYLYEFVYGFDEFGSRFRTILMILWCVHDDFGLGFSIGLDCFWVGFTGGFVLILSWIF